MPLPLLALALLPASQAPLTVPGSAVIYAAGQPTLPAFPGLPGTLPVEVPLDPNGSGTVRFESVTGVVTCCGAGGESAPDGRISAGTDLESWGGISGIVHADRQLFLVGVFLDDTIPQAPAPPRLDFRGQIDFEHLFPELGQMFFIGDGWNAAGVQQAFHAPTDATRMFLGFADGFGFHGVPGWYGDNQGSFSVAIAGEVVGRVVMGDQDGIPLKEARVTALRQGTTEGYIVLTDESGWFAFGGLPSGAYRILAEVGFTDPGGQDLPAPGLPPQNTIRAYPSRNPGYLYSHAHGQEGSIGDIRFPWPVVLQAGWWGRARETLLFEGTWDEAFGFLIKDPACDDKAQFERAIPAFLAFRMPTDSEAPADDIGYDNSADSNHDLNAQKLGNWIAQWVVPELTRTHVSVEDAPALEFSLVGHSMGGVIVRALATSSSSLGVARVVTLDGVHGGTKIAPASWTALSESSMNGTDEDCQSPRTQSAKYWNSDDNRIDSATGRDWLLYSCQGGWVVQPDDSAFGVGRVRNGNTCFWTEDWLQSQNERLVDFGHTEVHDRTCVLQELSLFLVGEGMRTICSTEEFISTVDEDFPSAEGVLRARAQARQAVSIPIDSSSTATCRVLLSGHGASYSLLDSEGVELSVVDLGSDSVSPGVDLHSVQFHPHGPGVVVLRLNAGDEEARLDWSFGFDSGYRAWAEADPPAIAAGQTTRLLARVADPSGYTVSDAHGSTVATVTSPSGLVTELELLDDGSNGDGAAGDGLFGRFFTETFEEGLYEVTCTARVEVTDFSVLRTAHASFAVAPSGVVLGVAPTVAASDIDLDGDFDFLELTYDVLLAREGSFSLRARLEDAQGTRIAATRADLFDGLPGSHLVALRLEGHELFAAGIDGPWILAGVEILDLVADSLMADTAPNVELPPFSYLEFDPPAAPEIHWLSRTSGHSAGGQEVILYGRGLAETTSVRFGPESAAFEVTGSDTLLVTVPALAPPSGPGSIAGTSSFYSDVEVVTPWGTVVATDAWESTRLVRR